MVGVSEEVPLEVRRRMAVVQRLLAARGNEDYGVVQRESARALGVSVSSVQRLMRRWKEQGVAGLYRQTRKDRGVASTSREWQEFIVKTYREGNRGSCRMSRAQVYVRVKVRAQELGSEACPGRTTVYRLLKPEIEQAERQAQKHSIGWKGDRLSLKTRDGKEIPVEWSNQVWQVDHTRVDLLIVDQGGEVLGRPWLTTVIDSYSRCVMGIHLGMEAPSAGLVCLALRHAILPKQYSGAYKLQQLWGTYGIPQYLYTDGGRDFQSQHLEQVTTELGVGLCLRRQPSDGGIVERPFGTFNQELFSTMPGYTGSAVSQRSKRAEREACLTLLQLERLVVRYIVDRYNQGLDARMGGQTRIGRWETGRIAQLPLLGERELDLCLMRQERRRVYRSGYVQFANLSYQGEHLAGYAGEEVVLRYNPRDITTILVYQQQGHQEVFLTRAHAVGLETESLSLSEAQAISRRVRAAGKLVTNQSVLTEVRDRDTTIGQIRKQKRKQQRPASPQSNEDQRLSSQSLPVCDPGQAELESDANVRSTDHLSELSEPEALEVPEVRVWDYEELKRNYGKWW